MPGNQANLGFWTAPPKRLSQTGDWFYPGEIAKAEVNVENERDPGNTGVPFE